MRIAYLSFIEIDISNACLIHTREIAEQFASLGHEVTIFLPRPLKMHKWQQVKHVWVRLWGFGGVKEALFRLESAFRILLLHFRKRFDLLYLREMEHNGLIPCLCKWLQLPLFIEVNGWLLDELRLTGASLKKLNRARKRQHSHFHKATGIVVSTPGIVENIAQVYHVNKGRILMQPLGTNSIYFKPGDKKISRENLRLPVEAKIFLFAGSFSLTHDLSLLLDAFSSLLSLWQQSLLILLGEGTQRKAMEKRANGLGISDRVLFTSAVSYENVGIWMQAADAGIIPLTESNVRRRNGCMTLKLWDYMASGLPIIATDLPGTMTYRLLKDYVILVPPGDKRMMVKAMLQIIENAMKREGLSKKGRGFVIKNRTWRHAALETDSFIRTQLKKTKEVYGPYNY